MPDFPKSERLTSHTRIEQLYAQGGRFMAYPLSVRYMITPQKEGKLSVLLASPKRYQRFAVNRNRIRRLLRETYRLNRGFLLEKAKESECEILLSVCHVSKEIPDYALVEQRMKHILTELSQKLQ